MPNSNKLYPVMHKIKNIDKKTSKSKKKNEKKTEMLLDSNLHLLSAKIFDYPLGYRGLLINFIQISNCTTIKIALFTKIHED